MLSILGFPLAFWMECSVLLWSIHILDHAGGIYFQVGDSLLMVMDEIAHRLGGTQL